MAAKRTLGRGLEALIPASEMSVLDAGASHDSSSNGLAPDEERVRRVPLALIEANPYQPRSVFNVEALKDLVDSIKLQGVLQPVLLRPSPAGANGETTYQLIAGERRWRAAQAAGLTTIPAIVRQVDDRQALEQALIENVQRQDLGPLDSARGYQRLAKEFGLQQQEIADRVGKSRVAVSNTLRLLELPPEVRQALEDGVITEGHGRAILMAESEGARRAVFRAVLRDGLSVRKAEQLARNAIAAPERPSRDPVAVDPDLRQLEQTLQRTLGTRLRIRPRGHGGRISIDYVSADDLQRLISYLAPSRS